jgi:DNA modification methylase
VEVLHADARATGLDDDSIDLVVTSPPYINVFNYHQRFRKSVEALDWDVLGIRAIGNRRESETSRETAF